MQARKFSAAGLVSTLALFGSLSTLFCCALPALFVALGAGALLAGLVSKVPQLIWLSEHKVALFIFVGTMLIFAGISRWSSHNAPCPTDPAKAKSCQRLRRISMGIFFFSLTMYVIGFFFAFLAQYLIA